MASPSAATADAFVEAILGNRRNMLVPYYLMLSYLYYGTDRSLVSDPVFDHLCKQLLREWDSIGHPDKHLIDKDSLAAGTGYYLQYSPRIKGGAEALWTKFFPSGASQTARTH